MPLATPWWPFHPIGTSTFVVPSAGSTSAWGHVRYERRREDDVVCVHIDFASPVISVLAGVPPFCTYAIKYREPIAKAPHYDDEINRQRTPSGRQAAATRAGLLLRPPEGVQRNREVESLYP